MEPALQVPGVRVISALAPSDGAMEPSMKVGDSSWKSVMWHLPKKIQFEQQCGIHDRLCNIYRWIFFVHPVFSIKLSGFHIAQRHVVV